MTGHEIVLMAQAMKGGWTIHDIRGRLYALKYLPGWWEVFALDSYDAPVYVIDEAIAHCSCPMQGPCKHLGAAKEVARAQRRALPPKNPYRG